jgi:hypothetical protein
MKLFSQRFRIYFKTEKLHFHEFTGCGKTTGFLFKNFKFLFSKITLYEVFLVKNRLSVLSNFQNASLTLDYPIFASITHLFLESGSENIFKVRQYA